MKKAIGGAFWKFVVGAVAVLAMPAVASAAVHYPSGSSSGDNDINDLDHHYAYTWRIDNLAKVTSTEQVTSASLTFRSLYNWDSADPTNRLYVHLLDTAKWSGVRQFTDEPTDSGVLNDAFKNTTLASQSGWLVAAGTADTFLTARGFPSYPFTANNPDDLAIPASQLPANHGTWTRSSTATGYVDVPVGADKPVYTYTYTFSGSQMAALQAYINNGNTGANGNIAIGLDADCHFYNTGVEFQYTLGAAGTQGIPSVPEPGTMLLLGSGLAAAVRYRRRMSQSTATKVA